MDKSYVSIETVFCPICGEQKETGNLLLDKRLQNRFERFSCTRVDLCPEHQAMVDADEYVAFFVVAGTDQGSVESRTGQGFLLNKKVALDMFEKELPSICHCDKELFDRMAGLVCHD